jgi:hypothetical protein
MTWHKFDDKFAKNSDNFNKFFRMVYINPNFKGRDLPIVYIDSEAIGILYEESKKVYLRIFETANSNLRDISQLTKENISIALKHKSLLSGYSHETCSASSIFNDTSHIGGVRYLVVVELLEKGCDYCNEYLSKEDSEELILFAIDRLESLTRKSTFSLKESSTIEKAFFRIINEEPYEGRLNLIESTLKGVDINLSEVTRKFKDKTELENLLIAVKINKILSKLSVEDASLFKRVILQNY